MRAMPRTISSMFLMLPALGVLVLLAPVSVLAQDESAPKPADDQQAQPAPRPAEEEGPEAEDEGEASADPVGDPLGDLDDLLDIPEEDRDAPSGDGEDGIEDLDSDRQELERRLTVKELSDQFKQAIAQMGEAADRMKRIGDVGIQTQRLQNEVLTKLDVLIEESKSQSSSSSSSSSPSNSDSQSQSPSQPQQQGQQDQQQAGQGENMGEVTPPPFESAELQRRLDLSTAEWGQLPERLRELLVQGLQGKHSALYEKLTEEFYKRIAEEEEGQ